ncbi:MAG: 2-isopropylmalate synthase, partial [Planctomycetes bacterium]|nr:2-isopropylmalate synthase [Planctomycetota bacterium]
MSEKKQSETDDRVTIFDTTLRDGEQAPGCSMTIEEKIHVARQLSRLGVDVIEAGFPIASEGDFESVKEVSRSVETPVIAGLARCVPEDIDRAAEALEEAKHPRIHVFLATSEIHRKHKLKKARGEILKLAVKGVRLAKKFCEDVEFSPEDASRTEHDFLREVVEAVIDAGAKTVNIPDTVGYAIPAQFGATIENLVQEVTNIGEAVISVHCHNDLGLGVSNSLEAVRRGARQVECTINGIGERAGNCSLEEVVMALATRRDIFGVETGIRTEQIMKTSRLVSHVTGLSVQRNKAIVGENAFAHEAGIHQDGMLKEKSTYEIMRPEDVGVEKTRLVLGKHSGRHAFRQRLEELGIELEGEKFERVFQEFKSLADKKKKIFDGDVEALVREELEQAPDIFQLITFHISSGTSVIPTATVQLEVEDNKQTDASTGDGPIDAVYKAIDRITGISCDLTDYSIRAISGGKDAMGEVSLEVISDDMTVRGR